MAFEALKLLQESVVKADGAFGPNTVKLLYHTMSFLQKEGAPLGQTVKAVLSNISEFELFCGRNIKVFGKYFKPKKKQSLMPETQKLLLIRSTDTVAGMTAKARGRPRFPSIDAQR